RGRRRKPAAAANFEAPVSPAPAGGAPGVRRCRTLAAPPDARTAARGKPLSAAIAAKPGEAQECALPSEPGSPAYVRPGTCRAAGLECRPVSLLRPRRAMNSADPRPGEPTLAPDVPTPTPPGAPSAAWRARSYLSLTPFCARWR